MFTKIIDIEDLLQRYESGERDFAGVNLNYRRSRDLSGIEGTIFQHTIMPDGSIRSDD